MSHTDTATDAAPLVDNPDDRERADGTAYVTRLVGGPGSGKSTLLRQFVRSEREDFGTSIGNMLISTFTRAARADMTNAMKREFPDIEEEDIEDSVRTLHSAALQACRDDGSLRLRSRDRPEAPGKLLIQNGKSDDDEYFTYFFRSKFPTFVRLWFHRDLLFGTLAYFSNLLSSSPMIVTPPLVAE